jgi:hypothetical protein
MGGFPVCQTTLLSVPSRRIRVYKLRIRVAEMEMVESASPPEPHKMN